MPDVMHDVARLELVPIEHELTVPFAIAGGGMDTARAVIVRVELVDGTIGLGECAPFPAVSGETVESTLAALRAVEQHGASAALAAAPAARCGLEQALLDARLRAAGQSVLDWMPPAVATIETDLTLPVGPLDTALAFVDDAVRQGFRTLKVKVGGHALADDVGARDAHPHHVPRARAAARRQRRLRPRHRSRAAAPADRGAHRPARAAAAP